MGMPKLKAAVPQTHPGIHQGVGYIGQDQTDDVQKGAEKNHGPYDGKILVIDGVNGVTAQAGNTEKGLHDQAAHEQQRQDHDHPGQNGDKGIFKDMTVMNQQFT